MDIRKMKPGEFHNLDNFSKYDLIKEAFKDLMDGVKPHEIQEQTGLSEERSAEIYHLFTLVQKP